MAVRQVQRRVHRNVRLPSDAESPRNQRHCGEGGALLINDPQYIERAEIIREKGTNRSRLFRGLVDKYTWIDGGSSYLPSDILAAFLLAQLQAREQIQAKRRKVWEYYFTRLQAWAEENKIRLPIVPANCEQPYHMFYPLMPSLTERQGLIAYLKEQSILAVFHFQGFKRMPNIDKPGFQLARLRVQKHLGITFWLCYNRTRNLPQRRSTNEV